MNTIEDLKTFCRLQYQDCALPIYFYQSNELLFALPEQTSDTHPPLDCLQKLSNNAKTISYYSTGYGIYFGALQVNLLENGLLVFGPVSNIPYSNTMFRHLYADYVILPENRAAFQNFFQICPQMSLNALLQKLIFINYCLNKEELTLTDILGEAPTFPAAGKITETLYEAKEDMLHNQSYEIETVYLDCIRTGNVKRLNSITYNELTTHSGIMAPTSIRQLKNTIIVTTTVATRAAIDGGLDTDTAFHLSDYYIQSAETTDNIDNLYRLLAQVTYEFTEKVAQCKVPYTSDEILQKAIRYILQNTNTPIKVSDVAEYVGFSRSYFSAYFKEKLGFSLSAFILRCKLEEGKQLLAHTNKSLSVISTYLCFSSQSHFQTAFKKQFGITPLQYRKNSTIRGKT